LHEVITKMCLEHRWRTMESQCVLFWHCNCISSRRNHVS